VGAHPEGGPLAVENHNIIGEGGAGFKVAGLRVVGCFEKNCTQLARPETAHYRASLCLNI